jgi:hypothetical protein
VEDLLDLVHELLALLHVGLARLALEEVLDLGDDAGGVDAILAHVRFQPRGRVAAGAGDADDHVLQFLLAPRRRQGRALQRAHPGFDPDVLEVGDERLAHRVVRGPRGEVAGVEPVRVACLGQQLLRARLVVGIGLEELAELQHARDQRARREREPERLGLVERLAVDGEARRLAHALVVPR